MASLACGPIASAIFRRLFLALVLLGVWLAPKTAAAYPWMLRHEYTGCATCHTDPSGGGLLTRYGRGQAALILTSRLGLPKDEEEPGAYKDFMFGVPLPDALDAQIWARTAYLFNSSAGATDARLLLMRDDAGLALHTGIFRASGMLGVASPDAQRLANKAWITSNDGGWNMVSREHWAGVSLADDSVLVRGGRINLPFGLRNIEHTMWVRSETLTDTNQDQQHGVAAAYTGEKVRGEAMAVLGNYQIHPDAYRERGYSLFGEYAVLPKLGLGLSSQVVHAQADPGTRRAYFRQAHGLFARIVPVKPLVLLAEGDVLIKSLKSDNPSYDVAGLLQADLEAVQGLHFIGAGEMLTDSRNDKARFGGWIGAWWFLFAHFDARVDLIERTAGSGPASTSVLLQIHGWL